MTKDKILPQVEEIKNLEEYGNELMEKIMENKIDWIINNDGNYQNDEGGEIINANNFTPEQNQKIKNCLEFMEFKEMVKQRGREGKVKKKQQFKKE